MGCTSDNGMHDCVNISGDCMWVKEEGRNTKIPSSNNQS
jgi:hypothetical protein